MTLISIGLHLIIFITVCSRMSSSAPETFRYFSTLKGVRKTIISKNIARGDDQLVLAHCDVTKLPKEIDCKISVRKISSLRESRESEKTQVFKSPISGFMANFDSLQIDVLAHGDKTLISWNEQGADFQSMMKYVVIIDMRNRTVTKTLKFTIYENNLTDDVLISNVVVYEQFFEVIVSDPKQCGKYKKCRITFNEEGAEVGQSRFPLDLYAARTISALPDSSKMGFFALVGSIVMRPDVYPVELRFLPFSGSDLERDFTSTIQYDSSLSMPITSNAHNLFTVCGLNNRKVGCNQFDFGHFVPKIDDGLNDTENVVAVHNIARGGFFLVALEKNAPGSNVATSRYKVTKVGADRKKEEFPSIPIEFRCSGNLDQITVVGKDYGDAVCFYFACVHEVLEDRKKIESQITVYKDCPKLLLSRGGN